MANYDEFLSPTGRHLSESAVSRMGTVVASSVGLVSFAAGFPDPSLFPWHELREIARELLASGDASTLQYGPTRGYAPLRESILGILDGRDIKARAEDLIVTTGSQQGIELVARVLVGPGDVVLVELPTYTGAIAAFKNAQADLVGVAQDPDGISLEDLEAVWERESRAGKRVKLLYVVPNFQNPTGKLLRLSKRRRLLDWANRRNVLIVEDDPYGWLYFDDIVNQADTRPLRADDSGGRVIYLSTFSKALAPGFRLGWMVAPSALVDRFDTVKQSMDVSSGIFDQRIVHEAVRRGVAERLAPRLRHVYQRKRDIMELSIREALGDRMTWLHPTGGFFIWATLPVGCVDTEVFTRALEQRLVFMTGSAFYVDGRGHDTIRLSFSAPAPDQIPDGVRRLAAALDMPIAQPA
jgi:2-aminoadipate transaminase